MEGAKKLRLRPARAEDAAALLAIYRPYVEHTDISFEFTAPDVSEFAGRIARISAEYPYLVCEMDGAPVGYAYAHRHMDRAAYDWNVETTIYLSEAARGHGIGSTLYRALLAALRMQNIRAAYACITSSNERSVRLHEKLGFQTVGVFENAGWKAGAWHDITWMRCVLAPYEGTPAPVIPFPALDGGAVAALLAQFE